MGDVCILVTGGAGYIGAHTCKVLAENGYRPVVYDDLSTGHRAFLRFGEFVEGDIRDTSKLRETIANCRVKAVMHFAAYADVAESVAKPDKYYDNNVTGTLSLLRAMQEAECRKIIFSSSCAVYGQPAHNPIAETAPIKPINPYGETKAIAESILAYYRRAGGPNFIALRYFNACGADEGGTIGELRRAETHLIPRALLHILGHCPDFKVLGTDFDTPDGTPIRDYVHVNDIARGHVLALRAMIERSVSGAFNLGTGRGYSVRQVLNAISHETGATLSVGQGLRRPGDARMLVADARLANEKLGWSPQHSDLKKIISSAWRWHQKTHPMCLSHVK